MKKNLLSLCLVLALGGTAPLAVQAASTISPANVSIAPTISITTLQQLPWQPLVPPVTQDIQLTAGSPHISQGEVEGAVAAFALPADRGSLEVTLSSLLTDKQLFTPSVLVLDEQMRPAAYYPSSYFTYEKAGIMINDRLQGVMKLTPALGQKQIYLLVYTTRDDLKKTTQLLDPAKAYAQGVGNAVPDIPDPIVNHSPTGTLRIKVTSEQGMGNIMIGLIQSAPTSAPVVVGSSIQPVAAPQSEPAKPAAPMLGETENYFNQAIKDAVKAGDVDKALKLLNEAEHLGSTSARKTFIGSVKGKG
ncbi:MULTISPECIES: maltose operon protein MalM [Yersinia pseudotuberculosis complex]|uniref:Maltose operon periplasmic protein n=1 Tax=Yersinia pseudotuberculosis serotype O:1b (strain IP 31758) TaxID=349747 RepID=A0A0U1QUC0_YERP3|nr:MULTISPECIES: maltose operon protein MalM [Yersinia pseudotuberculosis complex]ABS46021.1 maltose operon periplasmic protein [Yersinia pseudotuberculosis IP 31758]MCE4114353.1 maltose operon protein MalM [Yersinia pseudotuberculosis]MCF1164773.1 maltose operon protein MalM [Yersinia pseudotuberculosis]UFA59942.1 Maltose operon periplasmic protein MalM [Yersinia pseudotuberculosis]WLF04215.1 maltose operon protein MalM [Yersinia pseudotuberculosis]